MSMLCSIRGHRQRGRVLRNRDLQFGKCARCGCDLVRRAGGAWHEPVGHRIVWPSEPAPQTAAPDAHEEPVIALPNLSQDVDAEDLPSSSPPTPPPVASPPASGALAGGREQLGRILLFRPADDERDFMEDDEDDFFAWDQPARTPHGDTGDGARLPARGRSR